MKNSKLQLSFILLIALLSNNLNAQTIAVPDPIFEQALIDRNYDDVLDGSIDQSDVQNAFYLSINDVGINDITGIEAFVSLESLSLRENNLQTVNLSSNILLESVLLAKNNLTNVILPPNSNIDVLDLSDNVLVTVNLTSQTNLKTLNLFNNNLNNIALQNNVNIERLNIGGNNLSVLDVSNNINLERLTFQSNSLTNIDVSNLPLLTLLQGYENDLQSLDTSNNPLLNAVYMYENNIESLNFVDNPNITTLNLYNNELNYLNIKNGNNLNLSTLSVLGNPDLECIIVDDENYTGGTSPWGGNAWQYDDSIVTLSETDCATPVPPVPPFVYPNPFGDFLYVGPSDNNIDNYRIFSIYGNFAGSGAVIDNKIDFTSLPRGQYVIYLYKGRKIQTKKRVIKKGFKGFPIRFLENELKPRQR